MIEMKIRNTKLYIALYINNKQVDSRVFSLETVYKKALERYKNDIAAAIYLKLIPSKIMRNLIKHLEEKGFRKESEAYYGDEQLDVIDYIKDNIRVRFWRVVSVYIEAEPKEYEHQLFKILVNEVIPKIFESLS